LLDEIGEGGRDLKGGWEGGGRRVEEGEGGGGRGGRKGGRG